MASALEIALEFKGRRIGTADLDEVLGVLHPEVEWHTRWPGSDPVYIGHDGVRRWVAEIREGADFTQEVLEVDGIGPDRVLLTCELRAHGHGSGLDLETNIYDVWTFKDGLVVKRETFADRDEATRAASDR